MQVVCFEPQKCVPRRRRNVRKLLIVIIDAAKAASGTDVWKFGD